MRKCLYLYEARGETQEDEMQLTAVFEKVPKGYVGFVEEVPGTRTRGRTIEEVREKLADAVEHALEANRVRAEKAIKGKQVIREKMPLPVGMKRAELLQHLKRYT
jgi:predicted RNase H-like HicB family nuclease